MLQAAASFLKRKSIITIVVFILILTAVRFLWMNVLHSMEYPQAPTAVQGVLDLRNIEFTDSQTLNLDGEWEFFSYALIDPKDRQEQDGSQTYITVPKRWNQAFDNQEIGAFRYGTYRLRILLNEESQSYYAIRIQEIKNASAVYANGRLLGGTGQPSTDQSSYTPERMPYTIEIPEAGNEIELVIHVSNHAGSGGIDRSIRFGTMEAIQLRSTLSVGLQLLLFTVFMVHTVYAVILYTLGARKKELIYFATLLTCAMVCVAGVDDRLLFIFIPVSFEWSVKITYLAYINVMVFILLLFDSLYPRYLNTTVKRAFIGFCGLYSVWVLVAPTPYVYATGGLLPAVFIIAIVLAITIMLRALKEKQDVIFMVLALLSVGVNIVWTVTGNALPSGMHYPFDLMIAVIAFAAFWFKRFFRTVRINEQLVEQLRREDKRKDEFLVNTSHELRNPLHGIINITQTILDDGADPVPDKHRGRLELLLQVSRRLSIMLNDLLDITKLKEKSIRLQLQSVRLQSIVTGVLDMFRFMLNGKSLRLHVEIPDSFPAVRADENRLIQILFNLVHNAVKYTDQGSITVRASSKQGIAYIEVEDTGVGIEEDFLNRIFQPYEQADMNAVRAGGGFGLGLSICRQLVELHGGALSVRSVVGQGSIFTFTLPLATDASNSEHEAPETSTSYTAVDLESDQADTDRSEPHDDGNAPLRNQPAILIVDDDPVNLTVMTEMLQLEQYAVTAATNAQQALREIARHPPDLVITDVMMPRISGYELTSMIRKRYSISELPVLLLTARNDPRDIATGFQVGANDYICKPVDAVEIKSRVRALTQLKMSIEDRLRIEGAWLQLQIQPHFLMNTLNSIASLGVTDLNKMLSLLEEFSNYLRLSFDFHNTDPLVSLDRELSLVRSYLYIEKERFGDRLQVEWQVEESLRYMKLPPLSIQPLVENAVKHGVMTVAKGGAVIIAVQRRREYMEVSVSDTGRGMTKEQLEGLFRLSDHPDKRSSVGLMNIDRRLKQRYGEGLMVRSEPDQGTTVSFRISLDTAAPD